MIIRASKALIIVIIFIKIFLWLLFSSLYFVLSDIISIDFSEYLGLLIISAFFGALGQMLATNHNIEIVENNIGSASLNIWGFRKQKFVAVYKVYVKSSMKRTFLDRLYGRYNIYDVDGNGFTFNKYFFRKKYLKSIFEILQNQFEITFR